MTFDLYVTASHYSYIFLFQDCLFQRSNTCVKSKTRTKRYPFIISLYIKPISGFEILNKTVIVLLRGPRKDYVSRRVDIFKKRRLRIKQDFLYTQQQILSEQIYLNSRQVFRDLILLLFITWHECSLRKTKELRSTGLITW